MTDSPDLCAVEICQTSSADNPALCDVGMSRTSSADSPAMCAGGIPKVESEDNISKNRSEDNPSDNHEDNPEDSPDMKQVRDGKTDMAVEYSSAAAWTPIRVRKVKLGVEKNLGISPKSLKKEK